MHKFVDDNTLSEILAKSAISRMQAFCDELVQQSQEARMNLNGRKTKEMMIGPIAKEPPQFLSFCSTMIDRVTAFKLLGVYVSCDRSEHVDAIVSKAASRMHFLKQGPTAFLHICTAAGP